MHAIPSIATSAGSWSEVLVVDECHQFSYMMFFVLSARETFLHGQVCAARSCWLADPELVSLHPC